MPGPPSPSRRAPARPSAGRGGARGRGAPTGLSWEEAAPAPVVLVTGPEELLAERAVTQVVQRARESDPAVEVTRIDADRYTAGQLSVVASPSLFAEDKVVVLRGLESATDDAITDALAHLAAPPEAVVLVLVHGGGNRGKRLLDALRAAGVPTVGCERVKSPADKEAFVQAELRRAGRRAERAAVAALVDALGSDLRELAAGCAQLVADTTGVIGVDAVHRYHGGRIEASGFQVADAAVAGEAGRAVALLRHAMATGLDPVPFVAALAARLRTLARVGALRGRGGSAAAELGMAPWQVDRALADLRRWTPEGLADAITAVAQADAEVKGEGRDREFAVERAVLRVAASAGR
ncbi:DNA polymerase III subunit delta [Cellulomonas endophytica]|uniref:DNA polymerase III subunit delta n=1 Tax=Cellulomonas endophytica TaxID=2494735 RepID=UPI003B84A297